MKRICGLQKKKDTQYRPTIHCLSVESADGSRLFHTMTGELLLLEPGEFWESCKEALIEHRFLVPVTFDERNYVKGIRNLMRLSFPSQTEKHFTVFTTTDCNARCFYCYEKGRSRIPMTPKIAHDVAEHIARSANGEKVKLRWFGGEPLYNAEAIRTICRELTQRGISFSSFLVTNGLYLTEAVIQEAKQDWGLDSVQITLDGTEHIYNRIKAYIDGGENPFRQVLNHIDACLQAGIWVSIRLNVNENNAADIAALCDEFAERFKNRKGLHVYAAPIRNARGQTMEADKDAVLRIEGKLMEQGLLRLGKLRNSFKLNHCMADDDASVTILPDGRLGKCEHYSESETFGSIYSDGRDADMIQSWKEQLEEQAECGICPLYPQCIRLKKCEWEQFGCSEADRQMKLQRLRFQIASFTVKEGDDAL